jgi:hypothetical protein
MIYLKTKENWDNMTKPEFLNENIQDNKTIQDYLKQVEYGDYEELTTELYDLISMEGWLVSIEDEFGEEYEQEDFEYLKLDLSEKDRLGLINMNEDVVEKFSDFDMKLKKVGEYPYDTLDFIDYDNGIVYIIRLL